MWLLNLITEANFWSKALKIFHPRTALPGWETIFLVNWGLPSKLRYKAFDVDSYNNDYEIVLTFTGALGVYDAGKSGSVANAALKRAKIAQARKNAIKINNAARLGTIEKLLLMQYPQEFY